MGADKNSSSKNSAYIPKSLSALKPHTCQDHVVTGVLLTLGASHTSKHDTREHEMQRKPQQANCQTEGGQIVLRRRSDRGRAVRLGSRGGLTSLDRELNKKIQKQEQMKSKRDEILTGDLCGHNQLVLKRSSQKSKLEPGAV